MKGSRHRYADESYFRGMQGNFPGPHSEAWGDADYGEMPRFGGGQAPSGRERAGRPFAGERYPHPPSPSRPLQPHPSHGRSGLGRRGPGARAPTGSAGGRPPGEGYRPRRGEPLREVYDLAEPRLAREAQRAEPHAGPDYASYGGRREPRYRPGEQPRGRRGEGELEEGEFLEAYGEPGMLETPHTEELGWSEEERWPHEGPAWSGGHWALKEGVQPVEYAPPERHRSEWNYELGNYSGSLEAARGGFETEAGWGGGREPVDKDPYAEEIGGPHPGPWRAGGGEGSGAHLRGFARRTLAEEGLRARRHGHRALGTSQAPPREER